jgi:hypothetical protein
LPSFLNNSKLRFAAFIIKGIKSNKNLIIFLIV